MLSAIERPLKSEPAYRGEPLYGLLAFGSGPVAVWVVVDGADLFVDRDSDGELTSADRIAGHTQFQPFEIAAPSGSSYGVTRLFYSRERNFFYARATAIGKFVQYAAFVPSTSALKAPIAYFDGPLEFGRPDPQPVFARGSQSSITTWVGTPDRAGGCAAVVSNDPSDFTDDIHPVAEIEFPGQPPVVQRFELTERC